MSGTVTHFISGNSQACLDQNPVNNLFCAIAIQCVYRVAPPSEAATEELDMKPCGIFVVLAMIACQKAAEIR